MRHDTAIPARQPAADPRFAEVPPDRDRPGWWEHPNIDRPGARPHPATAPRRRATSAERSSA